MFLGQEIPCHSPGFENPARRGRMPQACMAKCVQIATVPRSLIEPAELGRLSPGRLREVEKAVLSALCILVPREGR